MKNLNNVRGLRRNREVVEVLQIGGHPQSLQGRAQTRVRGGNVRASYDGR